jgi:hypothetical protein
MFRSPITTMDQLRRFALSGHNHSKKDNREYP